MSRRSDAEKASDGCISTNQAAAIAGVSPGSIRHWVKTRLVVPTRYEGGTGNHARYDLRDTTALRAIADLRRGGVSMPNVRTVQRTLREAGAGDFASCKLAAVDRGARFVDVVLVRGKRERDALALSLLENPGQTIVTELALDAIEKQTRREFAKALASPAPKRGRKPGKRYAKPTAGGGEVSTDGEAARRAG